MIIPIGHEDSETRRVPWVTISLMALCFAAWVATLVARETLQVLPPEHYQEQAFAFWEEHSYLEMDEALAFYMLQLDRPELFEEGAAPDFSEEDWNLWLESKRIRASFGNDVAAQSPRELEAQEAELERLTIWGFYLESDEVPPEGGYPAHRFGLVPANPSWYGFVTHIFMHASWVHILGNLFLFYLVAPAMEDRWGRPLFAAFYLTAGVFAGGFFALLSLGANIPLVGASGAVAGVLGSFLVLYWKTKIKFLYYFFLPPVVGTFKVAAWVVLPIWLANEMLSAFVTDTGGMQGGVAYWAHVGGFLFGTAFATCVRGFRLEEKYLDSAIERKVTLSQGKDMVDAARRALEEGIYEEAFILFQQEASNRPNDLDSVLGYWEAGVAFYKAEEAALPLLAWMRGELAKDRGLAVAEVWCRAIEIAPTFPVDGSTLIKLVPILENMDRPDAAANAMRYVLSSSNPSLNAAMALRVRQLAAPLDPAVELLALHRILDLAALPVEKEQRVRQRLAELESEGVAPCSEPFGATPVTPVTPVCVPETSAVAPPSRPAMAAAPKVAPASNAPAQIAAAGPPEPDPSSFDPLGLSDGRAIEIDLEDDDPPSVPAPAARVLPPAVDAPDMSYFGDNSAENEPLGLMESAESSAAVGQPLAPAEPRTATAPAVVDLDVELGGSSALPRFSGAKRSDVIPVELASDHLVLTFGDENRSRLPLSRIQAVACAIVEDVSAKPIVVIDLLLNWRDTTAEVLEVVRIRSNTFDPRALAPNSGAGIEALRGMLAQLRRRANAAALPSAAALAGQPFARFGRLVDYEREVLDVASS